nr:hypothetical protein [Actinokineospora alba]
MSHRLSQWCSNAPDLEEDIALANSVIVRCLYPRRPRRRDRTLIDPTRSPAAPHHAPPRGQTGWHREWMTGTPETGLPAQHRLDLVKHDLPQPDDPGKDAPPAPVRPTP